MTTRLLGLDCSTACPMNWICAPGVLRLTADGRAALKRIEQPFRQINQKIEKALDADEIASACTIM